MPILERYIFRRVAMIFILTLGALVGTFVLTEALDRLDIVTAQGQTLWILFVIIMMAMPNVIQLIAPIAFLIAMTVTLIGLNADSEMAVMSASGAGRRTVIRPLMVFAVLLALFLAWTHHIVAPASLAAFRGLITKVRADLIASLVQDGTFRTVENGLTIHIRERTSNGSFLGIFVSDERNPQESVHYFAQHGVLLENANGAFLIMQSGDLVRENRETDNLNVVEFETYAFDLSRFTGNNLNASYKAYERTSPYLLNPDPDDTYILDNQNRAMAELHNRMSSPLYPLAFALIAIAYLGQPRTNRQASGLAVVVVVGLCLGIRGLSFLVFARAESNNALIPLLYVLPLSGIVLGSVLIATRARLGIPDFMSNLLDRFVPVRKSSSLGDDSYGSGPAGL